MAGDTGTHGTAVDLQDVFERYWSLRVASAKAKLDAALEVIHHNPTRGSVAEGVVLSLIREYLPRRWDVGTGFLIGLDNVSTEQIDVLVFDAMSTLPIYRDGELVVLAPGSVRAAIEVKKVLAHEEKLADAIANLRSVKQADANIACVLFAFESGTAATMAGHLRAVLSKLAAEPGFDRGLLPDTIMLVQRNVVFSRVPPSDRAPLYLGYEPKEPIARFLITQVLSALNLTNLQPFMKAPAFGKPTFTL